MKKILKNSPKILILSGAGGAGKTTIANLISEKLGFEKICGDALDTEFFPNGAQWLPENSAKLNSAHDKILAAAKKIFDSGKNCVVDYIIFGNYEKFFEKFKNEFGENLEIKILAPEISEIISRDKKRKCWTTGEKRIRAVAAEFENLRKKIGAENFIDNSDETAEKTFEKLKKILAKKNFENEKSWENSENNFLKNEKIFDLKNWENGIEKMKSAREKIFIGLAGKYNELDDAYISVIEAAKSAGFFFEKKVEIEWIDTEKIEQKNSDEIKKLKKVAGIIVPGGFGNRGIEGKILVTKFCREKNVPFLGLCLGSQIMAIEFARNILKISDATSEEFDEKKISKNHVVHFLPEQKNILKKGGTMRLGEYPCILQKNSRAEKIYGKTKIFERHRHRFEFNNFYRADFEKNGFQISGTSPDKNLVEIVEIKNHKFMIGAQFHPEFLSRPFSPHPLFREFLRACF